MHLVGFHYKNAEPPSSALMVRTGGQLCLDLPAGLSSAYFRQKFCTHVENSRASDSRSPLNKNRRMTIVKTHICRRSFCTCNVLSHTSATAHRRWQHVQCAVGAYIRIAGKCVEIGGQFCYSWS